MRVLSVVRAGFAALVALPIAAAAPAGGQQALSALDGAPVLYKDCTTCPDSHSGHPRAAATADAWSGTSENERRLSDAAHAPMVSTATFDREVRAILESRCTVCHAPGRPAPMPLVTYEDVRPWARAIKLQVLTRRMPVWHAAHGYGAFANDPSLSPAEMAIIAAWVDGGLPRTATPGSAAATSRITPVMSAFARTATPRAIPAGAGEATVRTPSRWIAGWDFEPGDPLVTAATLTSADGAAIGTWVAGDRPIVLPANAAIRITSPIHVRIERRAATDYEKPFTARRSILRIKSVADPPMRRVWIERADCGTPRTSRRADLLAIRPLLPVGASARLWLERPGAPQAILGWFRDADARYPRTYWLARATDLPPESRLQSDGSCSVELTLATR